MADEKYRTQLTGAQVDDALQQLNQRVAEGWAVGTRDGSPVGSGTEYYHNNAKYWAEQSHSSVDAAEAAAERAEAAVPAGTAGAVFFDRAQSLTDAQKEQAKKNIAAASSNPNLLDNSWFLVNSRGQSSYSTAGLTVDRWKNMNSSATTTVTSNGLTLTSDTTGGLLQNIGAELNTFLTGKNVTFSILFQDGTISEWQFVWSDSHSNRGTNGSVTLYAGGASGISINRNATISVRAFKLEIGSFSTLKYDSMPNYGDELTRCIYSTVDPADIYANNGFGRSNPNLCDNPWWGSNEVINQRGITSGTTPSNTYMIDRWLMTYATSEGTYSLGTNGLTLTPTYRISMSQGLWIDANLLAGKTLTGSIMFSDGSIIHGTINRAVGTEQVFYNGNGIKFYMATNNRIAFYVSATKTIRAIKLELGSVSTLANDVPPNYAEELAKCQRYFVRINKLYTFVGVGFAQSATNTWILIPTPVPLRELTGAVTISYQGVYVSSPSGLVHAITAISANNSGRAVSAGGVSVAVTTTGLTVGEPAVIMVRDAGGYVDISADI